AVRLPVYLAADFDRLSPREARKSARVPRTVPCPELLRALSLSKRRPEPAAGGPPRHAGRAPSGSLPTSPRTSTGSARGDTINPPPPTRNPPQAAPSGASPRQPPTANRQPPQLTTHNSPPLP